MCPNILLNQNKHELKKEVFKNLHIYEIWFWFPYILIQFLHDINYRLKFD